MTFINFRQTPSSVIPTKTDMQFSSKTLRRWNASVANPSCFSTQTYIDRWLEASGNVGLDFDVRRFDCSPLANPAALLPFKGNLVNRSDVDY
jgi:hypothetical protein